MPRRRNARGELRDRLQPALTRLQAPARPSLVSLAQTQQPRPVRKSCATRSAPSAPQPKWAGPHRIDRARTGALRAPAAQAARGGARAHTRVRARERAARVRVLRYARAFELRPHGALLPAPSPGRRRARGWAQTTRVPTATRARARAERARLARALHRVIGTMPIS